MVSPFAILYLHPTEALNSNFNLIYGWFFKDKTAADHFIIKHPQPVPPQFSQKWFTKIFSCLKQIQNNLLKQFNSMDYFHQFSFAFHILSNLNFTESRVNSLDRKTMSKVSVVIKVIPSFENSRPSICP